MPAPDVSVPVLIVGGGPTGLVASILLSNLGITHLLVERRTQPQQAPAAHVINRRTLEILRQCGLPMDSLYDLDSHGTSELSIRWGAGLRSPTLGELRLGATPELEARRAASSRERLANISQNRFERFLLAEARKRSPGSLRFGCTWKRFTADDHSCSEIEDQDGHLFQVRADYVLAADGAGSPVRRTLGIGTRGPDNVATMLSLSCEVDKTRIAPDSTALIDWCLDPRLSGVTITHDPKNLLVYMRPIHEPWESLDDYDDQTCHDLLTCLFGDDVPFRVLHKGVWRMTAQVAERFREGRVFLIGDSAHRFPPTGGLGLNSGVADAHNLVWKIAAHMERKAPGALLDSYEAERMPVVQRNCDVSLANFLKMDEVLEAIGLDPAKASLPARILAAPLVRLLPRGLRSMLFSLVTAPAVGLLRLAEADTARGAARRERIDRAIENQREHFDMSGLELGYVYRSGCAVSEKAAGAPEQSVVDYVPTTRPGARFPHIALVENGQAASTLDHLAYDAYTLVHHGDVDAERMREQLPTFGLPLRTFDIRDATPEDAEASLAECLDLPAHAWVLVRPDGHVAMRSTGAEDASPGRTDDA